MIFCFEAGRGRYVRFIVFCFIGVLVEFLERLGRIILVIVVLTFCLLVRRRGRFRVLFRFLDSSFRILLM